MENAAILALMYVAVGAGLFAQPRPGAATPEDFTWRTQLAIFRRTLPAVLLWPVALARHLRA
jgi:hypothetical protein